MSRSLLELLRNVTLDPGEHAAFSADPAGYLAQYGYEDVPADDLAEAFSLVADTLPADVALSVSPAALGVEAPGASAGSFGDQGAELASDGFAAGPDLDVDPAETTFGAVNNDFDEDAAVEGGAAAGPAEADDETAGELGAETSAVEARAGDDDFGFGEGSDAMAAADGDDGLADASMGSTDEAVAESLDEGGPYTLGPPDLDADTQGTEFGAGDVDDSDFELDDGFDFGSSGDVDIDDIGAF